MPVHFNSFIPDKEEKLKTNLFANMTQKYTEDADDIFVSDDKKNIHMGSYFKDIKTGKNIGKVVITLVVNNEEKQLQIVDTDITLLTDNKVKLHFERKLKESSEANEYYEVYPTEDERHFDIETVNRYSLKQDKIEGTDQDVFVSIFPFQLEIFDNEEELNKRFGFDDKEINIPGIGKKKLGMDPYMMAVGGMFTGAEEPCSLINGTINDFRDVQVDIAGVVVNFTIIDLNTAVGNVPVAVSKENFDLSKIAKDKIACMVADVKADFK
ncbi:MAG: hypothetical protein IKF17_00520 [Clostridia bacterium]|nr:hypothetical protein [Clostridia bacterium]